MRADLSPFKMMLYMFFGLAAVALYTLVAAVLIFFTESTSSAIVFLETFFLSFNSLVSGGLIAGTALIVYKSQHTVPNIIEKCFTREQLEHIESDVHGQDTIPNIFVKCFTVFVEWVSEKEPKQSEYCKYRARFQNRRRSITFSAWFFAAGFVVFSTSTFPVEGIAEYCLILQGCIEYALAVYTGRKLCYAGMMLHALLKLEVTRNMFKKHELDGVNSYVNILSTLTIIFVFVHVFSYFHGPFLFEGFFGEAAKLFHIFPAIVATPVLLIFNFYPRVVLRDIYRRSIEVEIKLLQKELCKEDTSYFERMSLVIDFERQSQDELRYRLQLTLSDLPIGITIIVMILGPLVSR